jgi:hypothetical protein
VTSFLVHGNLHCYLTQSTTELINQADGLPSVLCSSPAHPRSFPRSRSETCCPSLYRSDQMVLYDGTLIYATRERSKCQTSALQRDRHIPGRDDLDGTLLSISNRCEAHVVPLCQDLQHRFNEIRMRLRHKPGEEVGHSCSTSFSLSSCKPVVVGKSCFGGSHGSSPSRSACTGLIVSASSPWLVFSLWVLSYVLFYLLQPPLILSSTSTP